MTERHLLGFLTLKSGCERSLSTRFSASSVSASACGPASNLGHDLLTHKESKSSALEATTTAMDADLEREPLAKHEVVALGLLVEVLDPLVSRLARRHANHLLGQTDAQRQRQTEDGRPHGRA